MTTATISGGDQTVGLDVSDQYSYVCVVDRRGEVNEEARVRTTSGAIERYFGAMQRSHIVLEVGTHSPWLDRLLRGLGHEVTVANARQVRLIAESDHKHDRADAEQLARLGRLDRTLLHPIRHRGHQAQQDLALLRSRDSLVRSRTALINHTRGVVKAHGGRLPSCSTRAFHRKVGAAIPHGLQAVLVPHLELIGELTAGITAADAAVEAMIARSYPEARKLQQVPGVGPITALRYVLTIEDPQRFRQSRQVGPYLGLTPRLRQSGNRNPQLRISKAGDRELRRLLIGCAQYILGPFGPDSDLRRWGLRLAASSRAAKRRAVVAVARKLAVLLHQLWVSGEPYKALREAA